jgi:hypothetical protein
MGQARLALVRVGVLLLVVVIVVGLAPLHSLPVAAATTPTFVVTPLDLDFGPVGLGQTSAPQVVTIRNTGVVTLTNFAGGAPFDDQFLATQNCAAGVAPGASCQYSFRFRPTAAGVFSTTSDSSTNGGPVVVRLRGTGVGASASFSPRELDFGPVGIGLTSPTQIVTITNTSPTTLTNFAGGAPFDDQFDATQNCAAGVAPGASCRYSFTFSPTATGTLSTTSNSSTNGGPVVVTLNGTGVGASLTASPLLLDFGRVLVGTTSAQQVVTIRNTSPTTLTNFAGGAPFDTQFNATQNCAAGVPPGGSCRYFFTFQPTSTGTVTTTSNSSTNGGPLVITLRGTGTNLILPLGPQARVSPLDLDFGPVGLGQTSPTQVVTITNVGNATLTNFAGGAPFDTQFGASQNCAAGVAPGASCQYFFTFRPTATGAFSTTSDSSTNGGSFSIRLRGTGVGANASFSPRELDFGPVPIGQTSPQQVVTIRNTSPTTLTNFAGGAPFDTQFGASQNCAAGVAPGASCQYFFTFSPTATGTLSTTSNSTNNAGAFVIALRGTGITAPLASKRFVPERIAPNQTTTLELLLSNPYTQTTLTNVALSDNFPSGMQVASPLTFSVSPECGAATFAPTAGATSVAFSGGTIGGGASCVVRVAVTAGKGVYTNTTGPISAGGVSASAPVSATLTVGSTRYLPNVMR